MHSSPLGTRMASSETSAFIAVAAVMAESRCGELWRGARLGGCSCRDRFYTLWPTDAHYAERLLHADPLLEPLGDGLPRRCPEFGCGRSVCERVHDSLRQRRAVMKRNQDSVSAVLDHLSDRGGIGCEDLTFGRHG